MWDRQLKNAAEILTCVGQNDVNKIIWHDRQCAGMFKESTLKINIYDFWTSMWTHKRTMGDLVLSTCVYGVCTVLVWRGQLTSGRWAHLRDVQPQSTMCSISDQQATSVFIFLFFPNRYKLTAVRRMTHTLVHITQPCWIGVMKRPVCHNMSGLCLDTHTPDHWHWHRMSGGL